MHRCAVVLSLVVCCPVSAQEVATGEPGLTPAVHWNQWRGPERSGRSPGPSWPARLNENNVTRQWRVDLGPSYSGPVVDAERVYTTETVDRKREVVRALDRRTGAEVWQARWGGAMQVPFFAARNGSWIRSTPALDGEALFVAGMCDELVCLEARTGKERWRVDLADRFGVPREAFGFVCSPLVRGDAVYVQSSPGLVKLDRNDGSTIWTSLEERGGIMAGAFSSPVFATLGGREQLLVQTRAALAGVDGADGAVLWSTAVKSFRGMNILTPLPYGDGVFTSSYGGRSMFFAIAREGEALTAEPKWDNRVQGYMTSPVVVGHHAYLYLRSNRFTCIDLDTGETAWISPPLGDTYWSLLAQGDRILALTDAGELMLIAADPGAFEVLDRLQIAENETWAHLAVDGGQIFVRELDGLAAHAWQ